MSKSIIAVLLILNIAFSANAVFLKKTNKAQFNVFSQLQSFEKSDFGKKLLDTIALQVQNDSGVSGLQKVAQLLEEIRLDLVRQQSDADAVHNAKEQECADTISNLDRCIADNTHQRDQAQAEIELLTAEIARLTAEISIKEVQLDILNSRENELDNARVRDAAEFQRRQQETPEVLAALELVIEKLQTIAPNTNDDSLVLAELAKIGSSNPILALVQVASTFSPEALTNVINKMSELHASIEASIEDDAKEEAEAINEYNQLKAEISTTRVNIQNSVADLKTQLQQNQNALSLQERILEEAISNIGRCQDEKLAKLAECEAARTFWAEEKESRTAELNIVKQVEAIIATKLDTIKDYLKERTEVSDE